MMDVWLDFLCRGVCEVFILEEYVMVIIFIVCYFVVVLD